MNGIAFLLGIFAVPAFALWIGHRFRDRSPRQRSIFWGVVIGYSLAILAVSVTLLVDPVLWREGSGRAWATWWGLLAGGGGGALLGAVRPLSRAE